MKRGRRNWAASLLLAFVSTVLFIVLAVRWGFVPTAASDPLEYVGPAMEPALGFPYPDRLALWLWLRLFALLPVPAEWIGPIATLTQTALILFIAVMWLASRSSIFAGGIFGALYISAPVITSVSTYTYPMQLMTLLLVLAGIALCELQGRWRWLVTGCLASISIFAKVQAIGIVLLLAVRSLLPALQWRHLAWLTLGGVSGALAVFGIIALLDGPAQIWATFDRFLNDGFAAKQYAGRATGELPPFYLFFSDPTSVIAMAGAILPWFAGASPRDRLFAGFALVQTLSLLAIYVITARGGALITNYFFDALVFGLIAFCGTVGSRVSSGLATALALVVLGFAAAELGARFGTIAPLDLSTTPAMFPQFISVMQQHLDWLMVVGCLAVVLSRNWLRSVFTVIAAGAFGAAFFMALLFAGKGPLHAAFDREWSDPYHATAHSIMSATPEQCLPLVQESGLDSWRLLWLLDYLYQWPEIAACGPWQFPSS